MLVWLSCARVLLVGAGGLCLFWVLLCLRVMDRVAAPLLMGAFRVVFSFVGKIMCSLFFWPRRFGRGNVLFLDNGQAACNWCCVWWLFVLFLSGFWAFHCFCDSSDLKGFLMEGLILAQDERWRRA